MHINAPNLPTSCLGKRLEKPRTALLGWSLHEGDGERGRVLDSDEFNPSEDAAQGLDIHLTRQIFKNDVKMFFHHHWDFTSKLSLSPPILPAKDHGD
jgi:hypothetical protein